MGDSIEGGPDDKVTLMPGKTEPGISNPPNPVFNGIVMGLAGLLALWLIYYCGSAYYEALISKPPSEVSPFGRHEIVKHKLDGRRVMVSHCAWRDGWRCTIKVATPDGYKTYTVDRWELDMLAPGE